MGRHKEHKPWHDEAVSLFAEGVPLAEIARRMKKTRQYIHQLLIEVAGYSPRNVEDYRNSIISLYKSGSTIEEIVNETGKSTTLIRRLLRRNGVDIDIQKKKRWYSEAFALAKEGLSSSEIGERIGVDSNSVYQLLRNNLPKKKFDRVVRAGEKSRAEKLGWTS